MKEACDNYISNSNNTFNSSKITLIGNWENVKNMGSTISFSDNGIMYYDILNTNRLLSEFNFEAIELRYKVIDQDVNTIRFKTFIYVEDKELTSTIFQAIYNDPNNITISNLDFPQHEAHTYKRQKK